MRVSKVTALALLTTMIFACQSTPSRRIKQDERRNTPETHVEALTKHWFDITIYACTNRTGCVRIGMINPDFSGGFGSTETLYITEKITLRGETKMWFRFETHNSRQKYTCNTLNNPVYVWPGQTIKVEIAEDLLNCKAWPPGPPDRR